MQTYTKKMEVPRLAIKYDGDSESPRTWDNLGYFITKERNHYSPDRAPHLERIIEETGDVATSQLEHMELIKESIEEETDEKVLAIFPVCKYEHGGVAYSLGAKHGFDYSNNGFYIVTDKTAGNLGTLAKDFESVIKAELETYNTWVNGEIYRFTLYDAKGNIEDSCCGFYDIEDIRDYLPDTLKKEKLEDYINDEF